jgi:hypothetical protein
VAFKDAAAAKKYTAEWYRQNRDRIRAKQKAYREANPQVAEAYYAKNGAGLRSRAKEVYYRSKYGLSLDDVMKMEHSQGGRCAICQTPFEMADVRHRSGARCVDHDHDTGKVRGLICHHCNTGLGCFMDDPNKLAAAAAYLRSHKP